MQGHPHQSALPSMKAGKVISVNRPLGEAKIAPRADLNIASQAAELVGQRKERIRDRDLAEQEQLSQIMNRDYHRCAAHLLLAEAQQYQIRVSSQEPGARDQGLLRNNQWFRTVHHDIEILFRPERPGDPTKSVRRDFVTFSLFPPRSDSSITGPMPSISYPKLKQQPRID